MRAGLTTLGCKVNQCDTQAMQERLKAAGWQIVPFDSHADAYIVNSCTVTGTGDQKTRQMVSRAYRKNPDALIVVAGCYAQRAPEKLLKMPGVGLVVGTQDRDRIAELVGGALACRGINAVRPYGEAAPFELADAVSEQGRARAQLKIQDGCRNFCAYCIISHVRGPLRSMRIEDIARAARALSDKGFKEIVLVGIHLSSYGLETPGGPSLADAVEAVCAVQGIERVRLGSLEPSSLTEAFVSRIASLDKLCPQFHVSLQSGCDETLARMSRRYSAAQYERAIDLLRQAFADPAITTDVMVGFPGEGEAAFAQSLSFVEKIGFARVHVFPFSAREGTPAASMDCQVDEPEKQRRARDMLALARQSQGAYAVRCQGRRERVLVERTEGGCAFGHTDNYLPARIPGSFAPGALIGVRCVKWQGDAMLCRIEESGGFKMDGCIFCKIIAGDIPSQTVYQDDQVVAIRDIAPQAPVHVLVMPREHVASCAALEPRHQALAGHLLLCAARIARELNIEQSGYRFVLNTGRDGAQSVPHLHLHLLGGRQLPESLG